MSVEKLRRLRAGTAGAVSFGLVVGVLVFAVLADGRVGSQALTNSGGAWLLNRSEDSVGHVNRVVGEISMAAGPFSGAFDVEQSDDVVAVHDRGKGSVVLLDPTLAEQGAPVAVSPSAQLYTAPSSVILADVETGSVWTFPKDEFAVQQNLADVEPRLQASPGMGVAVGLSGAVAVADGAGQAFHLLGADGSSVTVEVETWKADWIGDVTMIGDMPVVLTVDGSLWVLDGSAFRQVDATVEIVQLQQSGVDGPNVVGVSKGGALTSVDLRSGASEIIQNIAGVSVADPIVHDGCVYAVTVVPVPTLHFCGRSQPLPGAGSELKLVLVNDWVWVNDVNQGGVWFVREDQVELEEVSDWDAAVNPSEQEDDSDEAGGDEEEVIAADADELTDDVDQIDEDDINSDPIAVDDFADTRRGRAVVIDVLANDTDEDNDPLSVAALTGVDASGRVSSGALVTQTPDGGAVQVLPAEDFVGEISFGYTVSDGRGGIDDAQVVLTVHEYDEASNQAPVTVDDNATVRAGESVALNVLTNDSDPDGDLLVLTAVDEGDAGAANFAANGEIVYSPDVTSVEGTVELTYVVKDDFQAEATGVARIRVRRADSNQKPEARNDVGRTTVGSPVIMNVLDNDVDPDGDPLFAQNLQSMDGRLTAAQLTPDGSFLFTPETPGTYRYSYVVSDGPEVDQSQIRIDVEARGENRPPVAVVDEVALAVGESRLVRVLDNDGDPDGDIVGIVDWFGVDGVDITEVPGVGFSVSLDASAQPRSSFRYWISDGITDRVRGTVNVSRVEREPVDYPPVAVSDTVDVRPGQTSTIQVLRNDYDPEGKLLSLVGPPPELEEGLVRISRDRQVMLLTVNPDQQFSFTFPYSVEDPAGNQQGAVVNVRIVDGNQANRAPVATPDIARTPSATPINIPVRLNDFDPDGDLINVASIAEQPSNGQIELLDDQSITYTPNPGFSGTDTFVYTLVDSYQAPEGSTLPEEQRGPSRALGQVFIGVMKDAPANRPPIAVDDLDFPEVEIGGPEITLDVLSNDTDPDGDRIIVTETTTVAAGSVGVNDGGTGVVYTPPESGEPRQVSFSYSIADGREGVATAQVLLTLAAEPEPLPPVANDDSVQPTKAGTVVTMDPRFNDADPDGDPAELVVIPETPLLSVLGDGQVRFTTPDEPGGLPYRVRDPQGLESATAFINVAIVPNEPPVINPNPITAETLFEEPVTIDIGRFVTDPENDSLVITVGERKNGGSVSVVSSGDSALTVLFTPDTDFAGMGGFDFRVDDQNGNTVSGRVVVDVAPAVNLPPLLRPTTVEAVAGTPSIVRLPDLVTDPDPIGTVNHEFTISTASSGNVTLQGPNSAGEVTIRSTVDSGGQSDSFTYTVNDNGLIATETISINLAVAQFAPPSLVVDRARVLQGNSTPSINLLANDSDNSPAGQKGDGLLVTAVGVTDAGSVARSGNSIVFTPDPDFFGTATFSYTVQDGRRSSEGESVGTVEIEVIGRPEIPQPPSVTSVGDRYLIVGWRAPQRNAARAPVTGYELRYTAAGGGTDSIVFSTPVTSHRWGGLTNAREYCFQVAAINEAGTSEFSPSAGSADCGTPDVRPESPGAPTVEFGRQQLTVKWNAPLNRGSAIKNYQVRISGGTQGLSAELGVVTQFVWRNLQNGTDYTFEVRAQNDSVENDGWSEWSPFSISEHPLTQPDAPGRPEVKRGLNQVRITWQAPSDGGDDISLYQVRRTGGSTWVDVTPQGITNFHVWQNIPNGTDIGFEVRAVNRDPASTTPGNISPSSPLVRVCGVPDAPPKPTVVRGDRQATVSWQAPNDQGCAITSYQVRTIGGPSGVTSRSAGPTLRSFTVPDLINGETYEIEIAAVNERSSELLFETNDPLQAIKTSPRSNSFVPAGPPLVSNILSATNVGPRSVRIEWSAADQNGSPITHYELRVNDNAWVNVGNTTSVTRTETSNGATYTYLVRAVNAVGPSTQAGASRTVTTWNVPGGPVVSASNSNDRQIRGSWSNPTDGGTGFTSQQTALSTGGCPGSGGGVGVGSTTQTWSGLNYSTNYRVCVRYANAVGWGPWGSNTARTNDAPPTSWTVRTGADRSCPERNFSAPSNWNGGACNGDGGGWFPSNTSVAVTCAISGYLADGTRTWFRMSGGPWPGWYISAGSVTGSTAGMPNC